MIDHIRIRPKKTAAAQTASCAFCCSRRVCAVCLQAQIYLICERDMSNVKRSELLSLYRSFLRVAQGMPTEHRQEFVLHKVRQEFRGNIAVVESTEQKRLYKLGITMLEQAEEQRKHLIECRRENLLDCELTPEE